MSEKFNAVKVASNFINHRNNYLKSKINDTRFYSNKYQFLFSVHFTNQNNKSENCYYDKINDLDDAIEILKELDVFESYTTGSKLYKIHKEYSNNCSFPCYIKLCEKFVSLAP